MRVEFAVNGRAIGRRLARCVQIDGHETAVPRGELQQANPSRTDVLFLSTNATASARTSERNRLTQSAPTAFDSRWVQLSCGGVARRFRVMHSGTLESSLITLEGGHTCSPLL